MLTASDDTDVTSVREMMQQDPDFNTAQSADVYLRAAPNRKFPVKLLSYNVAWNRECQSQSLAQVIGFVAGNVKTSDLFSRQVEDSTVRTANAD